MIWNNNKVVNYELQWMAEVYKFNFNKNKLTRSSYPSKQLQLAHRTNVSAIPS